MPAHVSANLVTLRKSDFILAESCFFKTIFSYINSKFVITYYSAYARSLHILKLSFSLFLFLAFVGKDIG